MVDTTEYFTTDSPYGKAIENDTFAQECVIESTGDDEFNNEKFIWAKVKELPKPIRLNKTNGRALSIFGNDSDSWVNQKVFLTTREVTLGDGRQTRGWVFTPLPADGAPAPAHAAANPGPAPTGPAPAAPPAFEDDIPF